MPATALLIIDAQVNMFDESMPVHDAERIVGTLSDLARRARLAGAPVVYVRNNGDPGEVDEPGTPGWEVLPALAPANGEPIIDKLTSDSFADTSLDQILQARGVHRLVIAGMQTEYCVATTARRAGVLGYEVVLAEDGHSTFDADAIPAAERIRMHNATLRQVAEVVPAAQIEFR